MGVGYSSAAYGRFRGFGLLTGNYLQGSINLKSDVSGSAQLSDMKTYGFAFVTGAGVRILGEDRGAFTVGLFAGPALMHFSNTFTFSAASVGNNSYSSNPYFYGALAGIQVKINLWGIILNPYALYLKDISSHCKSFTSTGGDQCLSLDASFAGIGINFGYKALRFNVYDWIFNDSSFNKITSHNYQLSYRFSWK